jgi:hypothetical protein
MAPIILFPGTEFIDQGPNEQPQDEVIRVLEEMIERAESGELQAVAVAGILSDGTSISDYSVGNGPHTHNLLAAVTRLEHKIVKETDAPDDEEDEEEAF